MRKPAPFPQEQISLGNELIEEDQEEDAFYLGNRKQYPFNVSRNNLTTIFKKAEAGFHYELLVGNQNTDYPIKIGNELHYPERPKSIFFRLSKIRSNDQLDYPETIYSIEDSQLNHFDLNNPDDDLRFQIVIKHLRQLISMLLFYHERDFSLVMRHELNRVGLTEQFLNDWLKDDNPILRLDV